MLREHGADAVARWADQVEDAAWYEAFGIGSAVYYGSRLKEAADLVRGSREVVAERPT